MFYYVETYGCQMNEQDSEALAELLRQAGYSAAEDERSADVIILNTCCVREKAENKVYGKLGQLKRLKEERPHLVIGVAGCMTQQPGEAEEMRRRAPYVDLILGTHNLHRLPELLAQARAASAPVVEVWEKERPAEERRPARRAGQLRAFVTVMYGCDNFCSYCIVPYVRGRERSREPGEIVAEVTSLVRAGTREVTLLGQNVNSYGKDREDLPDFAGLLEMVDAVPGLERIRFTTSHPKDFSTRLMDAVGRLPRVCEHVHLPVQAGGNEVLRHMNRRYSREDYLRLVEELRARVPGVALTTDLIVGFPGETEAEFEATLDLVERVRFDGAYTFLYSPRRGTRAARMEDVVPREVKQRRFRELVELQNRISREINEQLVGQSVEVLVEGPSKTDRRRLSGRTRTNKIVVYEGPPEDVGRLVPVTVEKAETWTLFGRRAAQ